MFSLAQRRLHAGVVSSAILPVVAALSAGALPATNGDTKSNTGRRPSNALQDRRRTSRLVPRQFSAGVRASCDESTPPQSATDFCIGFCTDIEGDRQYWNRYVDSSAVLRRTALIDSTGVASDPSSCSSLQLRDGCHFVFGGDAVDKGDGDLEVLADLIALKRKYPERVHLLFGNRDINKMRLVQELSAEQLAIPCADVYFTHLVSQPPPPPGNDTPAARLRWILRSTMGSPDAFELRRLELARQKVGWFSSLRGVSDDAVVASFREMAAPGGLMASYLELGELAVHYPSRGDCSEGGGVLFVHGAVTEDNMGVLPVEAKVHSPGLKKRRLQVTKSQKFKPASIPKPAGGIPRKPSVIAPVATGIPSDRCDVSEWVAGLNLFAREQATGWLERGWKAGGCWSATGGWGPDGLGLMQYGFGTLPKELTGGELLPSSNPTIVTKSWWRDGMPQLPTAPVQEYLRRSGVSVVVSGHRPHGDAPLLMASRGREEAGNPSSGLVVVTADTTMSAGVLWDNDVLSSPVSPETPPKGITGPGRGTVDVSEVLIDIRGGRAAAVRVHGLLSNGEKLNAEMPVGDAAAISSSGLGTVQLHGWWVKGVTAAGWLCSRVDESGASNCVKTDLKNVS